MAVMLLAMVRVLVRRNGTKDPAFALRTDTVGDAATAKQAFVDEAAGLLRVERTVPYEKDGWDLLAWWCDRRLQIPREGRRNVHRL